MRSASAADSGWVRLLRPLRARGLTWGLLLAIVLLQIPLWFGEGGWLKVRTSAQQVEAQNKLNLRLEARNAALLAEIDDLKQGRSALEERARSELGMIAPGEWFVRVVAAQSGQTEKAHE